MLLYKERDTLDIYLVFVSVVVNGKWLLKHFIVLCSSINLNEGLSLCITLYNVLFISLFDVEWHRRSSETERLDSQTGGGLVPSAQESGPAEQQ